MPLSGFLVLSINQSLTKTDKDKALKARRIGWVDSKKLVSVHKGLTEMLMLTFSKYFLFLHCIIEYTKMDVKKSKILGTTF